MDEAREVDVQSPSSWALDARADWRRTLIASAAAVVAGALLIVARAQVEQVHDARVLRCLQTAQAGSFTVNPMPSQTGASMVELQFMRADLEELLAECDG